MGGDGRRSGVAIGKSSKENGVVVDGQISEDEKIDKFYALIKNYKDACERIRMELERSEREEKRLRKRKQRSSETGDVAPAIWIPAFKWEDFAESSGVMFPASNKNMHSGDGDDQAATEVAGGGLDLRLRL